jgi:crotonobetainyl-CoA:carnitine CoA-transferase CaiB-like acyl-CoA transferase
MIAHTAPRTSPTVGAGALTGVRVLDLSHQLAGPYSTMILADLGADVVKVEQPGGGDYSRRGAGYGRQVDGVRGYFASINRGKRSIVLDLKNPAGKQTALELADQADVFVENMSAGAIERLGMSYPTISARNPRIVYASCSAFGQMGQYAGRKGIDPIIQAISGAMSINGDPGGPPVRVGFSISDIGAGMWMAMGILSALVERERSGAGQYLDISMLDCQLALLENAIMRYLWDGEVPQRLGNRHPIVPAAGGFKTSDSYIVIGALTERNWDRMCEGLGVPEWLTDPRFQSADVRFKNRRLLEEELAKLLVTHETQYWLDRLEPLGALVARVNSIPEALQDPAVRDRGIIQEVVQNQGTPMPLVGSPLRLSRTPSRIRSGAPSLGQHAGEVLREWLDTDADTYGRLEREGAFSNHA